MTPSPRCLALALVSFLATVPGASAQASSGAASQQSSAPSSQPAADTTVSSTVQPATTQLAQAIPALHPDKWKLPSELRQRASENLTSISNDLGSTLPSLVTAADTTPTLPNLLAVSRNLHALYDVVLRVATTSEIGAPDAQARAVADSLNGISSARQQLNDRIDRLITAQQQQLAALQTSLSTANTNLDQARAALQEAQSAKSTPTHPKPRRKSTASAPATSPPSQ